MIENISLVFIAGSLKVTLLDFFQKYNPAPNSETAMQAITMKGNAFSSNWKLSVFAVELRSHNLVYRGDDICLTNASAYRLTI